MTDAQSESAKKHSPENRALPSPDENTGWTPHGSQTMGGHGLSSEPMTHGVKPSPAPTVRLCPVSERDLPTLFEHQRVPEANEMAAFPARDRDAFMVHWRKILGDETVVAMTAVVDGSVAGYVGCWVQDGQRLVGYWIGKEHWGKGVATQMLSMFLSLVTDRPLYARVAKRNIASIRVLEKCGFVPCTKASAARIEAAGGIEELIYACDTPSVEGTEFDAPSEAEKRGRRSHKL